MDSLPLDEKRVRNLHELIESAQWIAAKFARGEMAHDIGIEHSGRFGGDGICLRVVEKTLSDGSKVIDVIVTA